ncbi:Zinc finger BED domain-containing protein 1, partial [Gryllus bimaculatus]
RNTSSLRKHLQSKHAHDLLELESESLPRRLGADHKEIRAQKRVNTPSAPHISTSADKTVQIEGDINLITDPNITFQSTHEDESSSDQNLCANAYFEQPEVVNILYKCRSIVAFISHNNTYKAKLRIQEQMMQLEENTLRMDYPRVWTSTYVMLEQLLIRRNIIISILTTADIVERDEFMLTQAEWKIMEEVVMVLEPFKVLIMTLSEEKTPFISLLKPLLCQLNNSHMKAKDSDSESAKKFKTFLSENLFQRYNDPKVHQLLQTATMLDARFKLLPDANEDDKNIVSGCIKEMLIKFMDEEQISNVAEEQSDERSRLSGMKFLLGDQCNSKNGMPAEEQADLEIMQYQSESIAALDHCPLQWWAQASAKCPSLARLARKYNCVPASASPPHRIPMESQVLFDLRRASLGPDLVEKLIFLNGNHSVNENVFFMPK